MHWLHHNDVKIVEWKVIELLEEETYPTENTYLRWPTEYDYEKIPPLEMVDARRLNENSLGEASNLGQYHC